MVNQLIQPQFLIIKQMKNKLILSLVIVFAIVFVFADNGPPAIYQPNYVYGETPMGVYMGNPYDMGDDMMGDDFVMPNGEGMGEYQGQSGAPEQQFQYIQGQEQLMEQSSKDARKAYFQEQAIGESMDQQYIKQIDQQTHQSAPAPIVLPTM
jgi:hypothetical protein